MKVRIVSLVAAAVGREDAGAELVARLRERIARVAEAVRGRPRPRVVCLEWVDPLFNAGHWVPEQVALAGGDDVLGTPGARSRVVEWPEVVATRPDVLCVMPCGFDAARATRESALLRALPGWDALPAVRAGRVHPLDGNAYFSRPGPRVVDGIEILASLFHPGRSPTWGGQRPRTRSMPDSAA